MNLVGIYCGFASVWFFIIMFLQIRRKIHFAETPAGSVYFTGTIVWSLLITAPTCFLYWLIKGL